MVLGGNDETESDGDTNSDYVDDDFFEDVDIHMAVQRSLKNKNGDATSTQQSGVTHASTRMESGEEEGVPSPIATPGPKTRSRAKAQCPTSAGGPKTVVEAQVMGLERHKCLLNCC